MKGKWFLATILLVVVLCFVSGVGYGEIIIPPEPSRTVGELLGLKIRYEDEPLWPYIERIRGEMLEEISFLKLYNVLFAARIDYMMTNPNSFLNVNLSYDKHGVFKSSFPESVDTENKIIVMIVDNRNIFSDKSEIALLDEFKRKLEVVYSYVSYIATNLDTDIAAILWSREGIPLAYFYQGECHLWQK